MATLLDYIVWRGDLSFRERPFNEVDNAILSQLAYFNYNDVSDGEPLTLTEVYRRFVMLENPFEYVAIDPLPALAACAGTDRFGSVLVSDFVNIIDSEQEIQFSAVTFHLEDGSLFVAYRGTDNTIVGWREDMNISYVKESPAQKEAVSYLNRIAAAYYRPIWVGGHSKGGNLAIYAAAFCDKAVRERIIRVYSNDGLGFNRHVTSEPGYQSILPRVQLIMPEGSVICILFSNKEERELIQSTGETGMEQHDPYTWKVLCDHFLPATEQGDNSIFLDETLALWLDNMDDEQRKTFVSSVFDVLEASGAKTLEEINRNKLIYLNDILKAAARQSNEVKETVADSLRKLVHAGRETLWEDVLALFSRFSPEAYNL